MIGLRRNEKVFHYKLYTGKTEIMKDNLFTGEYTLTYGTLTECRGSISSSKGMSERWEFGTQLDYDRVIIVHDVNCPITENSILWIDAATNAPHDYIVKRVAKSLNHVAIAIRQVTVR